MSYKIGWKFAGTKKPLDNVSHPCYARLNGLGKSKYFTVSFLMVITNRGGELSSSDLSEHILTTSRLKRIVNYWLHIGKLCGLDFKGTKWYYDHESRQLRFVMDISRIRAFEGNKVKLLHLHLFFLRFLTEKTMVPFVLMKFRKQMSKKYPHLSILNLITLIERYISEFRKYFVISVWDTQYPYPLVELIDKPKALTYSHYSRSGHHLFESMTIEKQVKMGLKPNLWEAFVDNPTMTNFDDGLFYIPHRGYQPQTSFKIEAEKVNEAIGRKKEVAVL